MRVKLWKTCGKVGKVEGGKMEEVGCGRGSDFRLAARRLGQKNRKSAPTCYIVQKVNMQNDPRTTPTIGTKKPLTSAARRDTIPYAGRSRPAKIERSTAKKGERKCYETESENR